MALLGLKKGMGNTGAELAESMTISGRNSNLRIFSLGSDNSLFVQPLNDTGNSTSVGGAVRLDNTFNSGAGFIIYSNMGASANGRLFNIRADNTAFDQAAFHIDYDGTSNVAEFVNNGSDSSSQTVNIVSSNPNDSTVGINGVESSKGTIKIVHSGNGSDSTASAISIDLSGLNTASQGIFIDSTFGTSGDLVKFRNAGDLKASIGSGGWFYLKESTGSPAISNNMGALYFDIDGSFKVRFSNGIVKTIATNS